MSYLKITNGQPEIYSIGQLRRDNPNTSFPKAPSDALLADWGVYPYVTLDQPACNPLTHTLRQTDLTQIDGVWVQGWFVEGFPVEQIAADQVRSIKATAGEAILARLPFHRQLNYQQRAIELLDVRRQRELTEQEAADYAHIMVERNWLEAMRAESNRLEGEVAAIAAADLSDDQKRAAIAALKFEAVA